MSAQWMMVSACKWLDYRIVDRTRDQVLGKLSCDRQELRKQMHVVTARHPNKVVADILWEGQELPLQSFRQLVSHGYDLLPHHGAGVQRDVRPSDAGGDASHHIRVFHEILMLHYIHGPGCITNCYLCALVFCIVGMVLRGRVVNVNPLECDRCIVIQCGKKDPSSVLLVNLFPGCNTVFDCWVCGRQAAYLSYRY